MRCYTFLPFRKTSIIFSFTEVGWDLSERNNVIASWFSYTKTFEGKIFASFPANNWGTFDPLSPASDGTHAVSLVVWPQWWRFADMSQQGLDLSKKISKIKIIFLFDFHRGRQKVPKSDFQCQFSMSEIIQIFLIFFSLKNISLGPHFL